jgi:type VI protein secretion system component VasF
MSEQETEALRREIERTRAELGATVEALSHKADVKTQAREKVEHAKQNVQSQARQRPVGQVAAGIAAAVVVLWLIRRRRS